MSSIQAGWVDDEDDGPAGMGHVIPSGPALEEPVQLQTSYLGLALPTPVVASSSPFTGDLASLKVMQAAGIGAVVLPSLFEEQLVHEAEQVQRMTATGSDANPEAPAGYHSPLDDYNDGATRYLKLVREAKDALDIPVIASLNGHTPGGWTRYAALLAEAGADAIELNLYRVAADPAVSGREIETDMLRVIERVAAAARVPIAVKLSPYLSALANLAPQLVDAGAAGLVLFNRFYQPDIDPETLSAGPHLVLSDSDELRLPLRWCALLHGRIDASLAATTGVHTARDVIKVLLAGADVAMTTSALLRHGPEHARVLVDGLTDWMTLHGYGTVAGMVGAVSQRNVADPAAYERANYLQTLTSYASTFLR
jgi:dihydroorotate dehydrogenase (fumarate)